MTAPSIEDLGQLMIKTSKPSVEWLVSAPRETLIEIYWSFHPRFQFFKTLPPNADLLDIGCADGGLANWRESLEPVRSDIRMYGVDLAPGGFTKAYAGVQTANLDSDRIAFGDRQFDAILASHVLEHLKDPIQQIERFAQRLKGGGRMYIEVPSPASKGLPRRDEFRAAGYPMMISNFFDDATHVETLSLEKLGWAGSTAGLVLEAQGVIRNPLVEDALLWRGVHDQDEECMLYGYWAKTGWAHFVVLQKPQDAGSMRVPAGQQDPPGRQAA